MGPLIELKAVTKSYGQSIILKETSLSIFPHQIIAVVGENGSGKSTLLKMFAGIGKPDRGEVIKGAPSLKIGYVPERTPETIPFTLGEYLIHMGRIRGMEKGPLRNRVDDLLQIFHMVDVRNTRIGTFSKGMKQKVTIMQAMLEETDVLILDEPLSGLDDVAQSDLEDILANLKEVGISIILSCHETRLLENLVDEVFVIKDKRVIQRSESREVPSAVLIFEIGEEAFEGVPGSLEVQKVSELETGIKRVETRVNTIHVDDVLRDLLTRGASIKELHASVHHMKEYF
ncbi:ABC transporter ATP-binding protein [Rossellomorea aquimaris]|uniref:ABC transporter ATP-binding protein n=1 Tax=Rossellomorea aquimaris TaxID=189382 RepID=UPI001CD6FB6E|nr:ABC transporter ATP-binding protein [Rossellomorea aquimaris]MCA1060444.1 ABC transporter ATP-binding protein [Rossellomorea aquimaris]